MGKTVRDVLVRTLENLGKKSFKRFKNKLNDWEFKEGYSQIPYGKLEEADEEDVAKFIINYYKEPYGIEVTLGVLEAIDERQAAENLRTALKTVSGCVSHEPAKREDQGAAAGDEKHFVDKHRTDLIQRVTLVAPILDDLLQDGLLPCEAYDTVRSINTNQEKMRALYDHVKSWGNKDKDKFLQSLIRHNPPLIRDLEEAKA
ncbi:apoptosis-associated speck-like protein containing a CARD isoform X1 [Eleutherodactylus coqui]|uniref:apoptosis-associated speck-like protein containing a CARD isoform X1 n=1 Tax=Eleutherodactylus coqui TaxID=57060 RepID=UPI00346336C6